MALIFTRNLILDDNGKQCPFPTGVLEQGVLRGLPISLVVNAWCDAFDLNPSDPNRVPCPYTLNELMAEVQSIG